MRPLTSLVRHASGKTRFGALRQLEFVGAALPAATTSFGPLFLRLAASCRLSSARTEKGSATLTVTEPPSLASSSAIALLGRLQLALLRLDERQQAFDADPSFATVSLKLLPRCPYRKPRNQRLRSCASLPKKKGRRQRPFGTTAFTELTATTLLPWED